MITQKPLHHSAAGMQEKTTPLARVHRKHALPKIIFILKKPFPDRDPSCASLSLAILLTLAPFYPPGNTKSSQKWLLSTVAVF